MPDHRACRPAPAQAHSVTDPHAQQERDDDKLSHSAGRHRFFLQVGPSHGLLPGCRQAGGTGPVGPCRLTSATRWTSTPCAIFWPVSWTLNQCGVATSCACVSQPPMHALGRCASFASPKLSAEVVMAPACLPQVFRAFEIDGEVYLDEHEATSQSQVRASSAKIEFGKSQSETLRRRSPMSEITRAGV